jgi:hypothetical protein
MGYGSPTNAKGKARRSSYSTAHMVILASAGGVSTGFRMSSPWSGGTRPAVAARLTGAGFQ